MKDCPWRLIGYSTHSAAENMAIDEAILEAHLQGAVPPTLRLYGWAPPAVSLGYGQKLPDPARQRIEQRGFDIVRRATGGRAVLHFNELTYSFVSSIDERESKSERESESAERDAGTAAGLSSEIAGSRAGEPKGISGSVIQAYKQICRALVMAMAELGVDLELGKGSHDRQMHDCFRAVTTADLHFKGKKMIGSAQLRRKNGVLQHGSILLDQPQTLMSELLTGRDRSGDGEGRGDRHANLFEIVNGRLSISELETAMKKGFETAFDVDMAASSLTALEMSLAKRLKESRYDGYLETLIRG